MKTVWIDNKFVVKYTLAMLIWSSLVFAKLKVINFLHKRFLYVSDQMCDFLIYGMVMDTCMNKRR